MLNKSSIQKGDMVRWKGSTRHRDWQARYGDAFEVLAIDEKHPLMVGALVDSKIGRRWVAMDYLELDEFLTQVRRQRA